MGCWGGHVASHGPGRSRKSGGIPVVHGSTGQQGGSNQTATRRSLSPSRHRANAPRSLDPSTHTHRHWLPPSSRARPSRPRDLTMTGARGGVAGHRVSTQSMFRASTHLAARRCSAALAHGLRDMMGRERQECDAAPHARPSLVRGAQYASGITTTTTPPFIPLPVPERSMPVGGQAGPGQPHHRVA